MNQIPNQFRYAKLRRVIDGDTIVVDITVDLGLTLRETLRFNDFDAPESFRPKSKAEKKHGLAAKKFLRELLKTANVLVVETIKKEGKYGRRISNLFMVSNSHINNSSAGKQLKHTKALTYKTEDYIDVIQVMKDNGFSKRDNYK